MDTTKTLKRLSSVWRHIEEVQRNCYTIAERLIEQGEATLGVQLAKNSLIHDQSKFQGIEWEGLDYSGGNTDKERLALSIHHHNSTNPHHPEYWGNIKNMPTVYVAEMCADWKARSSEFGSDLQEWIDTQATKRYGFTKRDKVYKEIVRYVKLLLEQPFVKL